MIKDLLNKACPPIDCICKANTPWGPCDPITGLQTNNCIPTQLPLKGGAACVSPTRPCGDCVWYWGPYGECDRTTGLKKRSPVVSKQPVPPDGLACPTEDQSDQCLVHCRYKWGDYQGTCNEVGDEQTRKAVCPTSPTPTPSVNPCPPLQPINGGDACPPDQSVPCGIKPCLYNWGSGWSTCGDPSVGRQKRVAIVTQTPQGGNPIGGPGGQCPPPEERGCKVDCAFTWPAWGTCDPQTGRQTRNPSVTQNPMDGYDGQGLVCPPPEERDCDIDCKGVWSDWSTCASPSGSYPPFKQNRAQIVSRPALNNGQECPPPEEKDCQPDVCFTAGSTAPKFGVRRTGMRPFRTLPPSHPAVTRADCGGPVSVTAPIPKSDETPTAGQEHCKGAKLFYSLDAGSGKSTSPLVQGKDGVSQIMMMQDSDSRLYFGLMNGSPVGSARADIEFEFTGVNAKNK